MTTTDTNTAKQNRMRLLNMAAGGSGHTADVWQKRYEVYLADN